MKLTALFGLLFLTLTTTAQPPGYDDLKILYADEDFEKLVSKALKYTEKDKTKKDPNPYIWASMGFYKISLSGTDDPDFKNAFKDGLKYVGKAAKYDKDGTAAAEHSEFLSEFHLAAVERIINDADAGDYQKAFSWNIKYMKVSQNPAAAKMMEGACKYRNSDKSGGNNAWKEAKAMLEEVKSIDDWMEADKKLLMHAVMKSAQALADSRQNDKAAELMNQYSPWFDDRSEYQSVYNQIVNG